MKSMLLFFHSNSTSETSFYQNLKLFVIIKSFHLSWNLCCCFSFIQTPCPRHHSTWTFNCFWSLNPFFCHEIYVASFIQTLHPRHHSPRTYICFWSWNNFFRQEIDVAFLFKPHVWEIFLSKPVTLFDYY